MKTFLTVVLAICLILACTKEFIEPQKVENKIYSVEDVPQINGRDGVKPTFVFVQSDVLYNPWDSTQTAYNKRLVLNTSYLRMGNDQVNFLGTLWGNYLITKRFVTGDSILIKAYAPTSYGNNYTIVSTLVNNQFDISALNQYVKIKQTKFYKEYFDINCTKVKREYQYQFDTNNLSGFVMLRPNKCNTYGFSWQLIF